MPSAPSDPHAVFISYSWDDEAHVDDVLTLAQWLRWGGVDAWLDRFDAPTEPWPVWTRRQVAAAETVRVVGSELYRRRVVREHLDGTSPGATWEGAIISNEVHASVADPDTFVPVVLSPADAEHVPFFLAGRVVYDVSDDDSRTDLFARLTGQRDAVPGPLRAIHQVARETLETALPVGQDVRHVPTRLSTTAAHSTPTLRQLVEGDWVIDVLDPTAGRTTMRLKVDRTVLGKRRYEGALVSGDVPGWSSSGEWEVLAPGNRVVFRGTQAAGPHQPAPLQEVFTFDDVGPSELSGVNAAGFPVSWHRQ